MKKINLLRKVLLLCALIVGSSSAWAGVESHVAGSDVAVAYTGTAFDFTHSKAPSTAGKSTATANDGSELTFAYGFLPSGTTSESACFTFTAKAAISSLKIYYTMSDSKFGSDDQSKSGNLVYKIGSADAVTSSTTGDKSNKTAYVETISDISKDAVVKLYSDKNRLVIFGVYATAATGTTFTMTTPSATTNVAINTSVVLTADETITAVGSSIAGTIKAGDAEANDITFTLSGGTTLTYTPASALAYSTTYVVTLSAEQVQNGSSEKNAAKSFTFTTMAAPSTTTTVTTASTGNTLYLYNDNVTSALSGTASTLVTFKDAENNEICTMTGSMKNGSSNFTFNEKNYKVIKAGKGTYTITPKAGVTINSAKVYFTSNDGTKTVQLTSGSTTIESNGNAGEVKELTISGNEFTIDQASSNSEGRIIVEINYDVAENVNVTVSAAGYATLYYGENLTIPAGVTAYWAKKKDATTTTVTLTSIDGVIPANTGVILEAAAGTYNFAATTAEAKTIIGNILTGTTTGKTVAADEVYTLGQDSNGVIGLRLYSGTSIRAYSAYMNASSDARFLTFDFEDSEATGISGIETTSNVKNEIFYDLSGRRIAQPAKGLYIVNGKKVIIK